ncbi:hypothetical protein, partial [Paenibacillus arenilitoris]
RELQAEGSRAASAPAAQPRRTDAPRGGSAAGAERKPQRVYIKIAAESETPGVLARLKELLAAHAGPLDTVLFYEQGQKSIALSDSYRVKPSPQLIEQAERLLGAGTIVVR